MSSSMKKSITRDKLNKRYVFPNTLYVLFINICLKVWYG